VNAKRSQSTKAVEKKETKPAENQVAGGEDRQNGSEERGEEVRHG